MANEKKEKKAKKERKFNAERIARLVRRALKELFPNETFHVSEFVGKVEVLYPMDSKITAGEINVFKAVFCDLTKTKKDELLFTKYEKKAA